MDKPELPKNAISVFDEAGHSFLLGDDFSATYYASYKKPAQRADFSNAEFVEFDIKYSSEELKQALIDAGGYQDWYYAEDWYLWIRMFLSGAKFYNIQENLMLIRINYDTFERRGGMKMFKSIKNLLKFMKSNKMIGAFRYLKECFKRFVGHVLVPKKMKRKLYMKFMRKESK
jgi:hypothetical protein